MAKSKTAQLKKGKGPPDPAKRDAFRNWLAKQPPAWSVAIAARVALRVLPLVRTGDRDLATVVLSLFRATAIARFAAKYPNRGIEAAAEAAALAVPFTEGDRATHAAGSAAYAAYSGARAAAAASAAAARGGPASTAAARADAQRLYAGAVTAERLAYDWLWSHPPAHELTEAWSLLSKALLALGQHWGVWTRWYENIALHETDRGSEAEDAAYTDVPGNLPWEDGAEAVNAEIERRLESLYADRAFDLGITESRLASERQRAKTLTRLSEIASPQPSITDRGQLDAGPNQPFDVPTVDDDLSTLPIRQRNLIKTILGDLPANAPKHLKSSLRSYDEELKVRGAQPILGLLKDDADIIAAAVAAPRAEDEWLEPGMRKALDRFADNHNFFVEHFPLDAEREAVYAGTPLNEGEATGKKLIEPFEIVAEAAREAHKAGATTDDFLAVIDKMTEFARIVSSQPPVNDQHFPQSPEIKVSPEDHIQPVTTKKRVILGALGFFGSTYGLIGTTVTIATASYSGLGAALKPAIEMLLRFLG